MTAAIKLAVLIVATFLYALIGIEPVFYYQGHPFRYPAQHRSDTVPITVTIQPEWIVTVCEVL